MPALAVGVFAGGAAVAAGTTALTALAVGGVAASAYDSYSRGRESGKKQELLSQIQKAQVADSAVRERRNQIRQQRIAQSKIENVAAQTGQQSSSAVLSGLGSIQSQASSNLGQINTALAFGDAKSSLQQDIFNLQQPSDLQYAVSAANSIFAITK